MKTALVINILLFAAGLCGGQTQDQQARKLANKVSTAFFLGLQRLDRDHLVRGRLKVTIENSGGEPEYEYKSFRSFGEMQRWMKSEENDEGVPWRESGQKLYCRKGLCTIGLVDGQMRHSHVFLTKMYYGYDKGRIFVRRLYIIYG